MKTALIILDGWGLGNADGNNAISVAKTPYVDQLNAHTPHATLRPMESMWASLKAKWATAKWVT